MRRLPSVRNCNNQAFTHADVSRHLSSGTIVSLAFSEKASQVGLVIRLEAGSIWEAELRLRSRYCSYNQQVPGAGHAGSAFRSAAIRRFRFDKGGVMRAGLSAFFGGRR